MGLVFSHPGTTVNFRISPFPLLLAGFNIQVVISTASADLQNPNFNKSLAVSKIAMAHLDTGASKTSIDSSLAKELKLLTIGYSNGLTAGGPTRMPNFTIDLQFPNTDLKPFINLPISSCNLSGQQNFSILLGRDILSRWNIVWNGPTSTVIIND
jgi:hypothetical protein